MVSHLLTGYLGLVLMVVAGVQKGRGNMHVTVMWPSSELGWESTFRGMDSGKHEQMGAISVLVLLQQVALLPPLQRRRWRLAMLGL